MSKFKISNTKYSLLYSFYSLPNIICPLLGGILIDKHGPEKTLLTVTLLAVVGQSIVSMAASNDIFVWMLLGRTIFGMGTETLMLVQMVDISYWFIDNEFALALGLSQFIANLFVNLSGLITPKLMKEHGIAYALHTGVEVCVFGFIVALMYVFLKHLSITFDE